MKINYNLNLGKAQNLPKVLEGFTLSGSLEISVEEMAESFRELKELPKLVEEFTTSLGNAATAITQKRGELRELSQIVDNKTTQCLRNDMRLHRELYDFGKKIGIELKSWSNGHIKECSYVTTEDE
jgi:hypothetical protein